MLKGFTKWLPFFAVFLVYCLVFPSSVRAIENRGGFVIDGFRADIKLQENGDFFVEENIEVDFSEKRHGIFRNIPIKYQDDRNFSHNLRISQFGVVDENGQKIKFDLYKEGSDLVAKIGDSVLEIDGKQVYKISYKVERGIRFFDDHAELYWNPIGTQWPTKIKTAKVLVELPKSYIFQNEDIICFEGYFGFSSRQCKAVVLGTEKIEFNASEELDPNEGLTIAVKFPLGYFQKPTFSKSMLWFLVDNGGFLLPVFVFGGMLVLWFCRGKELDLRKTTIPQYDAPDNLTPGEMNYLLKENYSQTAITADIINLAVKGFLRIREIGDEKKTKIFSTSDYELEKTKTWEGEHLTEHEKELLSGLFGENSAIGKKVVLSKLKSFYGAVPLIKNKLKDQIKEKGYFENNFLNYKSLYVLGGLALGFVLFFAGATFQRGDLSIGGLLSGIILIGFGLVMSKKTSKGAEAYRYVQGFRLYVFTAERYRVRFQEDNKIFEKVLPFAMVFGLAEKWGKVFEDIYNQSPDWYSGSASTHFSAVSFSNSLEHSFGVATGSASTPPSSSSSGFSGGSSGGGGGGGGGGSW